MGFKARTDTMNNKMRLSDFSSLSVISSVEKFVKSVDHMNETVMVPSRLLNVDLTSKKSEVPECLKGAADPYSFYTLLNNVKNSLVYGMENESTPDKPINDNQAWFSPENSSVKSKEVKGHCRRISSVSMASVVSSNSDAECERLSDGGGDSGLETEEVESVADITTSLNTHLTGVQNCLKSLTNTANFITDKYVDEVTV